MINKQDIIKYFDERAAQWDTISVPQEDRINTILDNSGIAKGVSVLDVACGTGVLFPYYLKRGVASVTAVDISPEMIKYASLKHPGENIEIICGDIETTELNVLFDAVVVYNAFPHFPEPERLIKSLAEKLKTGGRLSVAHGMSRSQLDAHHRSFARPVSVGLMHEDELERLFMPYFDVDVKISNESIYQVSGVKKRK